MKLAVVTMQKNERDTLHQWIEYYANLCEGYKHLYILDDCSTDVEVIGLLKEASNRGANVFWNKAQEHWFKNKGSVVTALVQRIAPDYDWILPADADEFICLDAGLGPEISRTKLVAELTSASRAGPVILRIDTAFANVPHTSRALRKECKKILMNREAGMIIRICSGYHLYDYSNKRDTVQQPGVMQPSSLATIHFHYRPFAKMLEACREKLKHSVSDFKEETMRSYRGRSRHLTQFMVTTEEKYLQSFETKECYDIGGIFNARGLKVPYSEAFIPMPEAERIRLTNPVNEYRYRPGTVSLHLLKTKFRDILSRIKRRLLQPARKLSGDALKFLKHKSNFGGTSC